MLIAEKLGCKLDLPWSFTVKAVVSWRWDSYMVAAHGATAHNTLL